MKKAFRWLLRNYLAAFILFVAVQILIMGIGLRIALDNYTRYQQRGLEGTALQILINGKPEDPVGLNNPLFVFSADRELLFSNRGKGKSISPEDYIPIQRQGSTIGYYYAGKSHFLDDDANRVFLITLLVLAVLSLGISLVIGLAVAVFSSRKIAGPVSQITRDIQKIQIPEVIESRDFAISELSAISRALQGVSKTLVRNEAYKRQWMQDIAHDLRTPISGLQGQLEGLRDRVLEPTPERFERNLRDIERLKDMVQGISELYAMENLKRIKPERIPTQTFVQELLAPYEHIQAQKGIHVEMKIEASHLWGQRSLLLRGIGNIVNNAYTYVKQKGSIAITLTPHHGGARLSISNNGPAIPEGQLDKIFNRFYRGEYARRTSGTGLGLNIARAVVQRHRGTITVKNLEAEQGVLFTVTLPGG